jgi:hypothetical protein
VPAHNRECIAKWRESLPPLSPEEAAQRLADFRRELDAAIAGLPLPRGEPEKPARAKKPRGNKTAAMTANNSTQGDGDKAPAPAARETQLSPEKVERINRIWNDYVTSEQDNEREPGPRITQL